MHASASHDTARRLLILGGNRYNLPAIQAAREAGFFTLVADRNAAAPGLAAAQVGLAVDLVDAEGLAAAALASGPLDGVVTMAEVGVRAAARLAAQLSLPSISEEAAARATSKAAMRRCWAGLGAYSTDFAVVRSEAEAFEAATRLAAFPLICKPDRSFGGSRGVSRVETAAEIPQAFQFARSCGLPGSDVVVERCVEGAEYSAEVLIWEGQTSLLAVGQKVKSEYPYRVDLSVQYPAPLAEDQEAAVRRMCQAAVTALGLTQGVAHIEFARTAQGPILFELGARCGGGHTPLIAHHVSGVHEFVEACRMACGLPPQQFAPCRRRGADYRFLIFPPGKLVQGNIPDAVRGAEGILDSEITAQPGEELHAIRTTADRVGFVVALGADLQSASRLADWACRQISVTYADDSVAAARCLNEPASCSTEPAAPPILDPADARRVVERYRSRIAAHGVTFASLASGSQEKQDIRHCIHTSALRSPCPGILDVGCGLADYYRYLEARGRACSYTGYDIVPEYIAECRRRIPAGVFEVRNIFSEGIGGIFDTIVMSQVLNNRYRDSDNLAVMRAAMEMAFRHTRESVSIDMMSSYVDFRNPDLYYYSPEEVLRIAKSICRRVALRHDFRPFEFCIQLFHDEAGGYLP
jgi:biotin carboxylase/SAM-dependent methyltransferase